MLKVSRLSGRAGFLRGFCTGHLLFYNGKRIIEDLNIGFASRSIFGQVTTPEASARAAIECTKNVTRDRVQRCVLRKL